jgi:hypothetical protein
VWGRLASHSMSRGMTLPLRVASSHSMPLLLITLYSCRTPSQDSMQLLIPPAEHVTIPMSIAGQAACRRDWVMVPNGMQVCKGCLQLSTL